MPIRHTQNTYTKGEIDPKLQARFDTAMYQHGADKLRNVVVVPQGGARRRWGTRYKDEVPYQLTQTTMSGTASTVKGGTAANLLDGDRSSEMTNTTSLSNTDLFIFFEYDHGSDVTAHFVDVEDLHLSAAPANDVIDEVYLEGRPDGSGVWTEIGDPFSLFDENKGMMRRRCDVAYRYYRLIRKGTTDAGGTQKMSASEFQLWENSASLSVVRQATHIFNEEQKYTMVFSDRNVGIYRFGALVADVEVPFTSAQLGELTWASKEDIALLFMHEQQTWYVQRRLSHGKWQTASVLFSNIPQYDFGAGNEDSYSDARGWPRTGLFLQGRLFLAGSTQRPSTVIASKSGSLYDLNVGTGAEDDAIVATADPSDSQETPTFVSMFGGPHLQLFSTGGEYYVPVSDNAALTPSNFSLRLTTSRGAKPGVRTFDVGGATFFLQKEGGALREFLFTDLEGKYEAQNLSLLSSHLLVDPTDMDIWRSTSADEADFVLLVNGDGTLAVFTTLRQQEIAAWSLGVITDGSVVACNVEDSNAYISVQRNIAGSEVNYFEQLDFDVRTDCAVTGTGVASSASVPHLEGKTVDIILDGALQTQQVVPSGGLVTFERDSAVNWEVGLPWPDVKAQEDARLIAQGVPLRDAELLADGVTQLWVRHLNPRESDGAGSIHGKRFRYTDINVEMHRTSGMVVRGNVLAFRSLGSGLLDQAVPEFTGTKHLGSLRGWGRDNKLEFTSRWALPFHLMGSTYNVEHE